MNRELAAQPHTGHLTNVSGSDRLAARYVSKVSPVRFNEVSICRFYYFQSKYLLL